MKTKSINEEKELPNHIKEYLLDKEENHKALTSRQLFEADHKDIDFKTELITDEIKNIVNMRINDDFLIRKGFKPVFKEWYYNFMRLQVSKERKGRSEFVQLNKSNDQSDLSSEISKLDGLNNILSKKK